MKDAAQCAIQKALLFLSREQHPDGSFPCFVSTIFDAYKDAEAVPAIVPTNMVLSSLACLSEDVIAHRIKQRAADFLLQEKSQHWSFNYWFRHSDSYVREPYPDDLDDTFCALAALHEYDKTLFDGRAMADIATMLISAEKQEGGPYDMWLVPPTARERWNDTDLVVNSNIAFFLSLRGISLPNINDFVDRSIEAGEYEFPYNTIYPAIYFVARFYKGKYVSRMTDLLVAKQENDGKWENPLRTALAVTALMYFSGERFLASIQRGIAYLLSAQEEDGSWPVASFFFQMKMPEKTLYAGAPSITTALCIEAIGRYLVLQRSAVAELPQMFDTTSNPIEERIDAEIRRLIQERFLACGSELQQEAKRMDARILQGDLGKSILLLPFFFRAALGEPGKAISDELVIRLGAANGFGWMAYTVYDDFLDEEGDPRYLSPANICLRTSAELFGMALSPQTGFQSISQGVFDAIDSANAWEIAHARASSGGVPKYGDLIQLAQRSFGHALSPIALLCSLQFQENSLEVRSIWNFFEHYLIARQLDDDMHDWQEDMDRGRINAVAAQIAYDASLDLDQFLRVSRDRLREQFWHSTIIRICEDIEHHIVLAKEELKAASFVLDPTILLSFLEPIERSMKKALTERLEAKKFLEAYQVNGVDIF